jgi:hypothetical protein
MIMILFILVCLLAAMPVRVFGMDIAACGLTVPRGDVGDLRADLTCGPSGSAVFLASRASLNLNGFTIAGSGRRTGVECGSGRGCAVNGPGTIVGFETGISGSGRFTVRNVGIRSNDVGITSKGGTVTISGVVATENRIGIYVPAARLRARDLEASRNGDCGVATIASRTRLESLTAVENGGMGGVYASKPRGGRIRITDSTILRNDGLGQGYDVITTGRAKFVDTICGRGARIRESPDDSDTRTIVGELGCRDD